MDSKEVKREVGINAMSREIDDMGKMRDGVTYFCACLECFYFLVQFFLARTIEK